MLHSDVCNSETECCTSYILAPHQPALHTAIQVQNAVCVCSHVLMLDTYICHNCCAYTVQARAEGELNALEAQMRLQEEAHERELGDRLTEKLALDKVMYCKSQRTM